MSAVRPITDEDLHAYVDAALDPARRAEVEDYLARFPDVARRVQGYADQRAALRAAFAPVADEPVPSQLSLARLVEARRRPRRSPWYAAAAAILLAVLGGVGGWSLRGATEPPQSGIAALAQEAADSYAVFGPDHVHPVEIKAADSAELIAWVSQRLRHPVTAPDLSAAGYRFMGGRLVATAHGPAGLFMYDNDHGTRLVMLVRPMAIDPDAAMTEHSHGDVAGYAWAAKGVGYSLVGPTPPAVLHPIANEIRRQVSEGT